jgi:hypothetical protein
MLTADIARSGIEGSQTPYPYQGSTCPALQPFVDPGDDERYV